MTDLHEMRYVSAFCHEHIIPSHTGTACSCKNSWQHSPHRTIGQAPDELSADRLEVRHCARDLAQISVGAVRYIQYQVCEESGTPLNVMISVRKAGSATTQPLAILYRLRLTSVSWRRPCLSSAQCVPMKNPASMSSNDVIAPMRMY